MQPRENRAYFGLVVRIVVSVALVAALAYGVGTSDAIAQLNVIRWQTFAVAVAILASHVFIIAPRWALILRALGYPIRNVDLLGSVLLGFLFNQVLPTAIGGDALKVWRVQRLGVPLDLAIHSVLIDRGSGIAVVLFGAILLLPFASLTTASHLLWQASAVGIAAAFVACIGLWLLARAPIVSLPGARNLQRALVAFASSTQALLLHHPGIAIIVTALALAGQLVVTVAIWLLSTELQVALPLIDIAIITFGAMLASAIPISIAGWGIREGTLLFLFGAYGVPADKTFAISVSFGACMMLASLPGSLVLLSKWDERAS